jgi:NADH-quinone oxidoreductase subunit J
MAAINWHSCFFLLMALLACGSAVAVVFSGNIVRMAFYLVVSLSAVAGLFFLAGAEFLGAAQLMVYVGGTVVLLAFGVMLTARGPFVSMGTGLGQWLLGLIVGGALLGVLLHTVTKIQPPRAAVAQSQAESQGTTTRLGLGLVGVRRDLDPPSGKCGYLLVFEIISVHLLVVMVGAAYLARAKRRQGIRD